MPLNFLDRVAALSATIALAPFFAAIAGAIKLEDKGPVFFSQERVGFKGKTFLCHKFRTMFVNAEELLMHWKETNHPIWIRYVQSNFKLKDDPRVTRVGKFLRQTSLDELPQLINILAGDMKLVGPRPLLARELPDYGDTNFEFYKKMIPGLTGLWQVSGRSNTTFADRARLDVEYFNDRSLFMDLKIIIKTISVLFRRTGAF